jgi:amino-acid N-acetyltransferase
MESQQSFVTWFRDSSPYIHAHRHKTFVISFGGEAVPDPDFDHLVHDFALLSSLGIHLVLVHGIRPQIDQRLKKLNAPALFHKNLRITDDLALQCVKEAAGLVRVEIEALLSMGLANTPMAGYGLKVASGNFVTAKPIGVIDGIDYGHTGEVRRIDGAALHQQLDQNTVVLISPIGYSPSGEVFNLSAEQVATAIAIELKAEKLILLTEQKYCNPDDGQQIQQMTAAEAEAFLEQHQDLPDTVGLPLKAAIQSCRSGVGRVHLIDRATDGALLLELFTHNGIGTLISSTPFEEMRPATLNDIFGILELIKPLEQQGILAKRSREKIEMEIADYIIIERDGLIIGCTALHTQANFGAIACMAVHPDYRGAERGNRMLETVYRKAKKLGLERLFVLSTQTMHWFIERGFVTTDLDHLPEPLRTLYNPQRNSKILVREI